MFRTWHVVLATVWRLHILILQKVLMTNYLFLASVPLEVQSLLAALVGTAAFGILGIVLMLIGFKLFEFATRRLDIEKQLENQNIPVGIVVGSLLIGISLIVIVSMM